MKTALARAYMKTAYNFAELSYCVRRKVGCVIVKDDRIISIGYNGTPPGWENCCEDENNKTLPHVIHAEANAIAKLAKTEGGGIGSTVFVTTAPCIECAKQLATIGIKELYYAEDYRGLVEGIHFLQKCGVPVSKLPITE